MKKLSYFILILFIGFNCIAQETGKLPKKPWEEIVEINSARHSQIKNWNSDINVKLEGNYTTKDSLQVARAIAKLDSLTEAISIKFSKNETSNLKLIFSDSIVYSEGNRNGWIHVKSSNNSNGQLESELYIYTKKTKPKYHINESIETRMAKQLVGGYFALMNFRKANVRLGGDHKRASIFNPINQPEFLNIEDMAIIKEVYSFLFHLKLENAKEQFKYVLDEIEDHRNLSRDRSLWWVKNPVAILILPTIILLLVFVLFTNKIYQIISPKIKKGWLKFGIITLIALLFTGLLIILYVSFNDFLRTPSSFGFSFIRYDTVVTTAASLIGIFPFICIMRFIELKIRKSSQQIFTKTLFIFLSTGLLPFAILFMLVYFTSNFNNQNHYFLSQVFVLLLVLASIRALISFFIFKERSLIVENETKLSHLRELKTQAELKSLQSQINPHFLYNSLNSIASLAPIDSKRTQEMAHSLSDLFKYSINRKGKKMSTIKDEIDMVNTYLGIEKIRFGDRLKFVVEVDKAIENYEIPLFLIQPLIENAVKHGISKQAGNGEILLKIKEEKNELVITVSDSGPNFPKGLVSGHGLQTVYDLLRLSYGDKASLNWTNLPEKTITITMPKKQ